MASIRPTRSAKSLYARGGPKSAASGPSLAPSDGGCDVPVHLRGVVPAPALAGAAAASAAAGAPAPLSKRPARALSSKKAKTRAAASPLPEDGGAEDAEAPGAAASGSGGGDSGRREKRSPSPALAPAPSLEDILFGSPEEMAESPAPAGSPEISEEAAAGSEPGVLAGAQLQQQGTAARALPSSRQRPNRTGQRRANSNRTAKRYQAAPV